MPPQLVFDLTAPPALGRGDFFVSPANVLAVRQTGKVADWPDGKLLLTGPRGSGKTHLARIWAAERRAEIRDAGALPARTGGPLVIENIDRIAGDRAAETALFHLHNIGLAAGHRLLMTGTGRPQGWGFALPDLASRIEATMTATLAAPDDALLAAVMVKLFADRQIAVPPSLIPWLVTRMERSFAAAHDLVALLDARALALGRPVTRPLAAEVLDFGAEDSP